MIFISFIFVSLIALGFYAASNWVASTSPLYAEVREPVFWCTTSIFLLSALRRLRRAT